MAERILFKACAIKPWTGRYARIPGDSTVFHIRDVGSGPTLVIEWPRADGVGTCPAIPCDGVKQLVKAVSAAKGAMGGSGRGSFQINEFGQVVVPASDGGGRRMLCGEIQGKLLFTDPFVDAGIIDLSSDAGLRPGDPWHLPYVGVPYNLSGHSRIYFYRMDAEGGQAEYLASQDLGLIKALRAVRRSGAARFIVNPYGLVATKKPSGREWGPDESWEPIYIGRIDPTQWFSKET